MFNCEAQDKRKYESLREVETEVLQYMPCVDNCGTDSDASSPTHVSTIKDSHYN